MRQLFGLAPRFPSFRGFWRRFRRLDPRPSPSGRLAATPITPESNWFAKDGVHFFPDLLGLRSGVPLAATAGAFSGASREAFGLWGRADVATFGLTGFFAGGAFLNIWG